MSQSYAKRCNLLLVGQRQLGISEGSEIMADKAKQVGGFAQHQAAGRQPPGAPAAAEQAAPAAEPQQHHARAWWHSQSGGRSSALAISTLFTTLVLMPFPRPSICSSSTSH